MHNRRLLAAVIALLAIAFGATAALASVYHDLREDRVRRHLERARQLAAEQRIEPAAAAYAAALRLERDHLDAGRGLALSLLALNRLSEADPYIRELLARQPTDGPLNRGLARIAAAQGRPEAARVSYQRAIYGEWPDGARAARIDTRLEFIDHLRRVGARDEVLAELLRLRAELRPGQTAVARRIADVLAEQNAAALAIETLQATAAEAPRDVALLSHLAGLELREGRVAAARDTLRRAVRLEPEHRDLTERLQLADRILALDPTLPGLRLVTRTRRARLVLSDTLEQTRRCAATTDAEAETLARAAARRLRQRARPNAESAEEELELASRLWSRFEPCHDATPAARALTHVLRRVTSDGPARP
jgi:tetratricopeptide (TPR) repeat protein